MAQLVAHLLCKQRVRGSSPLTSTREQLRQHSQALAPDLWFGAFVVPGMCLLPQPFSILLPSSILTVILDTGSRSAETIRLLPTRLGRHTQPE